MLEKEIVPQTVLVLPRVSQGARGIVSADPIEAALAAGTWARPQAGDSMTLADGKSVKWAEIAGKDGAFEGSALSGGYAYINAPVDQPTVAILEAAGHSYVYVNGEPRTGDIYSNGYVRLPVSLRKGGNDFLFKAGRGSLKLRLLPPVAPIALDTGDSTLPDLRAGESARKWGAVIVINATDRPLDSLKIKSALPGSRSVTTPVPHIEAMSVRKVGFRIEGRAQASDAEKVPLHLALSGAPGADVKGTDIDLRVRKPGQTYKQTFISDVDGSVQYFAVNPAQASPGMHLPALALSLHGASVEAIGQADAYGAKSWTTLVAPTNRRPYGYDWEDWGRIDAMEVLGIAQHDMDVDTSRTYLVGHSMGGHGTWQVGAIFPDRFAAIAPSAGWISAYTYSGGRKEEKPTPLQEMLHRAAGPMDTLNLASNYASEGVYILHGTDDDNVPVTEARHMRDVLSAFHHDFIFHEEPKQSHWWDISDEPGADCVDWAPMWDFLAKHTLPPVESVRQVDFVTANPGVSARCHWATIVAQEKEGAPSEIHILCDPQMRRYNGTTVNVSRLAIEPASLLPGAGVSIEIDGQKLTVPDTKAGAAIHLSRAGGQWTLSPPPAANVKNPSRYGPFRAAFDHRFQFVYGTHGTPEENAWAAAKARYDSECWWYRGNGSVDVLPDSALDPSKEPDRGVVLYGNARTNGAWTPLLKDSPVTVAADGVTIGDRRLIGDDLACLFIRPRSGSSTALVAAVSGTGIKGMRVTNMLSYLQPMVGYPDVFVVSAEALEKGPDGVRVAGFFGSDWAVPSGDFEWQLPKEGTK